MNICQERNKNQSCRRKNFRDSPLSTFMMKRIRLEKKKDSSGGLSTELQFSPEPNSSPCLLTIHSALSVTLCHLSGIKEHIGASVC